MPKPGFKNSLTVAGVDSDGDGIRDDVQRWINRNYYKDPNLQNALKQYARDKQRELESSDNKALSIKASHEMLKTLNCLDVFVPDTREMIKLLGRVKAVIINNGSRHRANMKADSNFHGEATGSYLPKGKRV